MPTGSVGASSEITWWRGSPKWLSRPISRSSSMKYWIIAFVSCVSTVSWAADDPKTLANKADVLRFGLSSVSVVAVHEVTDTAGKVEKQIYTVTNHLATGNSFIVISSENSEVN